MILTHCLLDWFWCWETPCLYLKGSTYLVRTDHAAQVWLNKISNSLNQVPQLKNEINNTQGTRIPTLKIFLSNFNFRQMESSSNGTSFLFPFTILPCHRPRPIKTYFSAYITNQIPKRCALNPWIKNQFSPAKHLLKP